MELTTLQITSLRRLLEKFVDALSVEYNILAEIHTSLFSKVEEIPVFSDQELHETFIYFKRMVKDNKIESIEKLVEYYEGRLNIVSKRIDEIAANTPKTSSHKIFDKYFHDAITSWRRNSLIEKKVFKLSYNINHSMIIPITGHGQLNSSTKVSWEKEKQISIWDEAVLLHFENIEDWIKTSPNLDCITVFIIPSYLRHFSSHENEDVLFCKRRIMPFDNGGFQNYCTKELSVYNQSDAFEHNFSALRENLDSQYRQIIEIIKQEKPLKKRRVKKDLAEWVFTTKCVNHYFEDHLCLPDVSLEANKSLKNIKKYLKKKLSKTFGMFYENIINEKEWHILISPPGFSWLTSDNPGLIIEHDEDEGLFLNPITDSFLTNTKNEITLYYPLSKEYCLRIKPTSKSLVNKSPEFGIDFLDSTKTEWEKVNRLTAKANPNVIFSGDRQSLMPVHLTTR